MGGFVGLISEYYLLVARFLFVFCGIYIFIQIKRHMLGQPVSPRILAVLYIENGVTRLPITHFETTIGRSKSCDVVIPLAIISRQHAVLSMSTDGSWRIADTCSKGGIFVNGEELTEGAAIQIGDEITLAGVSMTLMPASSKDSIKDTGKKSKYGWVQKVRVRVGNMKKRDASVSRALYALNLFQILACMQFLLSPHVDQKHYPALFLSFGVLLVVPWVYRSIAQKLGNHNVGAEIAAFFLSTLGFCTAASAAPDSLFKQLAAMGLGLVIFCVLCAILKNLELTMKLRPYAGVISLVVLAANLVLGATINGQRNWIRIGSVSIQPSEFVKILFIFAGAATLQWLLTTKNLTTLTVYASGCIGLLFLMGDFGTALIFFFTFIVLIFMTSGDMRAIALTVVAAGLGALLIISYKPYITQRFASWGRVWEQVNDSGFQQTRALMAIASGGMLGIGGGNGFFHRVYAADTDLVFGVLWEEWGMIIAFLVLGCYALFLFGAIRSRHTTRSSYYVIAACTAATVFLFQASLNVFGTTDVLPITGVTLPFISNGGSSLAASWGMLSFITAALNYERPKQKEATPVAAGKRRMGAQ